MNALRYTLWTGAAALALALALPTLSPERAAAQHGPANLTVRILWQTPAVVELQVNEPNGGVCWSGHPRTPNGGSVDQHIRSGQSSRQYTIEGGPAGEYRVGVGVLNNNGATRTAVTVLVWENRRMTHNEIRYFETPRSPVWFTFRF